MFGINVYKLYFSIDYNNLLGDSYYKINELIDTIVNIKNNFIRIYIGK